MQRLVTLLSAVTLMFTIGFLPTTYACKHAMKDCHCAHQCKCGNNKACTCNKKNPV